MAGFGIRNEVALMGIRAARHGMAALALSVAALFGSTASAETQTFGGYQVCLAGALTGSGRCVQAAVEAAVKAATTTDGHGHSMEPSRVVLSPEAVGRCGPVRVGDPVLVLHGNQWVRGTVGGFEGTADDESGLYLAYLRIPECRDCRKDLALLPQPGKTPSPVEALALSKCAGSELARFRRIFRKVVEERPEANLQANGENLYDLAVCRVAGTDYYVAQAERSRFSFGLYVSDGVHLHYLNRFLCLGAFRMGGRVLVVLRGPGGTDCDGDALYELKPGGPVQLLYRTTSCAD
jgi:hypothetical protein